MAGDQTKIIESRLGRQKVELSKVIHFPKGLIGLPGKYDYILLQLREGSPFLVLQSMDDPALGLLVADPFSFFKDYVIRVSDSDQVLLKAGNEADLAVLVTATIPPGKPEETALTLNGPILINHKARLGAQIPQPEDAYPDKVYIHQEVK